MSVSQLTHRGMKFAISALLLLSFSLSISAQSNLEKAMNAAFNGPRKDRLKICGHHFNVKVAKITKGANGSLTVKGKLSHNIRFWPDDEIEYTIQKQNGVIKDVKLCFKGGKAKVVGANIVGALATYWKGKPIPADSVLAVQRKVERVIFGNWRSAAEFIVTNIAMRACTQTKKDVLALHRAGKLSKSSFQAARVRKSKPKPRPRPRTKPTRKTKRQLELERRRQRERKNRLLNGTNKEKRGGKIVNRMPTL